MPGDPFILANFIDNFEKVWADEVDTLYVLLNIDHRMSPEVTSFDVSYLAGRPKVVGLYVSDMLFQGAALRYMLPFVKEDIIMSIEDDVVISKKGQIDKCFRKIETGDADVVGSPRFSCSQEILDASAAKYGLDYSGYGDKGPNFWPNFFFIKKKHLLQTDLHFEPKGWAPGELIEGLDIVAQDTQSGDVFVWLSIQLRAMGLKFVEVPQYHSRPSDLEDMAEGLNLGDINCDWVHIGSLTMTAEDFLIGAHDPKEHNSKPKTPLEKKEMERRYAWLKLFLERTKEQTEPVKRIRTTYETRMNNYTKAFDLSVKSIDELMQAYRRFFTW